ncbi:MAG: cobalamin biosynthesis protein [Methanomassiliicoccales archaeon PtaU1.Bin124]|nr:MAG: cobalamin biosynthesis protein [Methanomassiliicoccales archaeon PtaU1.Bin124]
MELILYGLLIAALGLALDLTLGEPPNALHPVVWIGKVIGFLDKRIKRTGQKADRRKGVLMALTPLILFPLVFTLLLAIIHDIFGALVWAIACAIVMKTMFAITAMERHVKPIMKALENNDLEKARHGASMIVSRDVSKLDKEHIISCAAESAAENTVDSAFSPLFFFGLGGIPLMVFYRVSNTLDAMVGYMTPKHIDVGRFSAILDDYTNWICARLSVPFLLLAMMLLRLDWRQGWAMAKKYKHATKSPNKGWSMSAFAGGMGIRFEKYDYYQLGDGPLPSDPKVIGQTIAIMKVSTILFFLIVVLPLFLFIGMNVQLFVEGLLTWWL